MKLLTVFFCLLTLPALLIADDSLIKKWSLPGWINIKSVSKNLIIDGLPTRNYQITSERSLEKTIDQIQKKWLQVNDQDVIVTPLEGDVWHSHWQPPFLISLHIPNDNNRPWLLSISEPHRINQLMPGKKIFNSSAMNLNLIQTLQADDHVKTSTTWIYSSRQTPDRLIQLSGNQLLNQNWVNEPLVSNNSGSNCEQTGFSHRETSAFIFLSACSSGIQDTAVIVVHEWAR